MSSFKVLYRYVELLAKETVKWFENDYNDLRDGKNGHTQHPEVVTHEHVVKRAIESANQVNQDKSHKDRKCYYAWFAGDGVYKNQHMKAVVKRSFYGKLRVTTAYFTSRINPAEVELWPTK